MNSFNPHSMLVSGGAGFIGSNFIRYVLSNEPTIKIINIDKLTYAGSLENLKNLPHPERHHFIQGDINDAKLIRHLFQHHQFNTIVHFAAETHVDRSIASPSVFIDTNITGTFTLLEAAKHLWFEVEENDPAHCLFHHISTDEVYGSLQKNDAPFTEETAYQPNSPYAATKASSDHLVKAYFKTYGLPITISHCSNNYGPHQHAEKFIPTIIRACLNWQKIPVYGNGKNSRDWLYVDDHCRGVMEIIKHGKRGETYNLGANNEWENLTLAKHICKIMDELYPREESYSTLLEFVTDRPGHDFRYAIDSKKINKELGWTPQESFATGLKKTIQFYLNTKPSLAF